MISVFEVKTSMSLDRCAKSWCVNRGPRTTGQLRTRVSSSDRTAPPIDLATWVAGLIFSRNVAHFPANTRAGLDRGSPRICR